MFLNTNKKKNKDKNKKERTHKGTLRIKNKNKNINKNKKFSLKDLKKLETAQLRQTDKLTALFLRQN